MMNRDDAVIIRISSIQRKFADQMHHFSWNPQNPPNQSSTDYSAEVLYLVKKVGEPFAYARVPEFTIFNSEARAQLFSHAFGYRQKAVDFGVDFETRLDRDITNINYMEEGETPVKNIIAGKDQ
jgi:hypothetical protein